MWCSHTVLVVFSITIFYESAFAWPERLAPFRNVQKSDHKSGNQVMDNVAAADEHHRIVILVPQIIRQEKKKPKSHHHPHHHHHHGKVIPVVHSGKVIHAHHHHGKVDHLHGHDGKAKHEHKHQLTGGHKHSHFGVGTHKHKHSGKADHDHKHSGKGSHKHEHSGKGSIHHLHEKHHPHHHQPKTPPKKFKNPFYGFDGGESDAYSEGPRVKIDAELLRALNPANALLGAAAAAAAASAPYANANPGRIIQIRIPDETEAKEFDVDTQSEVALLKKNYVALEDDDKYVDAGLEYFTAGNQDEAGDETDDTDGESEYQLGDGYKLAATAAARAATLADDTRMVSFTANDAVDPAAFPAYRNNGVAFSDAYYYQQY